MSAENHTKLLCSKACSAQQLLKYVQKIHDKNGKAASELSELFHGELNPVAPKAQRKVPVPEE